MSPSPTPAADDTLSRDALSKIASLLLAVAALAVAGLLICAIGWYRSQQREVSLERLTSEERQGLVDSMIQVSPGAHNWAFFEPRIAYTLQPNAELEIWNSTFTSNKLGYRTGPLKKPPGTVRIVFVGDSWTYGMGVERQESFPEVFAELVNHNAGLKRPVEAWTLALPGYNLHNSLAGLDFFFNYLQPDAVVVVPSGNDNFSSNTVLPNGAQWSNGLQIDEFGEPHQLTYRSRRLDSYRFQERWRQAFARLKKTEDRLRRADVPLYLFFLARWHAVDVHHRIQQAGLQSPYAVVPTAWTVDPWSLPPPIGHGTAAAHRLYARLLYRGIAEERGWPRLPQDPTLDGPVSSADVDAVPVFKGPPGDWDGTEVYGKIIGDNTRRVIPTRFLPPEVEPAQLAGPIDPKTGLLRRAATVLIRPEPGHRHVVLTFSPLADAPSIYPMDFTVHIPSPSGGSRVTVGVDIEPKEQRLSLPIPQDLVEGSALDIVMVAENTISSPELLAQRSLQIRSIETSATP